MSQSLTTKRAPTERLRSDRTCEHRRTTDSSTTPSVVVQTSAFVVAKRRRTKDPQRPASNICRPGRWEDTSAIGVGRIHAGMTTTTIQCRRRSRSAGALATLMRLLVLVVAVLGCETHAATIRPGLPRDTDAAVGTRSRPPQFRVRTYDEALVSPLLVHYH